MTSSRHVGRAAARNAVLRVVFGVFLFAFVVVGCGFDLAGLGDAPLGGGGAVDVDSGARATLFAVAPTKLTLSEKTLAPATFTMRLAQAPSGPVTVPMITAPEGRVTLQPSTLTFTPDNFAVDQTVTVTTTRNSEIDPSEFIVETGPATSSDPLFDGADPPDVTIAFEDANPAINIEPRKNPKGEDFSVLESGTTTIFYVSLNAQPTDKVTFHVHVADATQLEVGTTAVGAADGGLPATFAQDLALEFPAGWPIGKTQTVTVRGKRDNIANGNQSVAIEFPPAESTDPRFKGKSAEALTIVNIDVDSPNVLVSKSSVTITEPSTPDTFTVALATEPVADVTIAVHDDKATGGNETSSKVSPATLTFDKSNWATPQTVTVTPIDNLIVDGTLTYVVHLDKCQSADPVYNGKFATDVTVTNLDGDAPALAVSPLSVATSESGSTANVSVALGAAPAGNVVVDATSSAPGVATVTPSSLTFTSANWQTPQSFVVKGVHESPPVVEGARAYQITVAVDKGSGTIDAYKSAPSVVVNGSNADIDTAAIVIASPSLSLNEAGSPGSFQAHLATAPSSDVTLTFAAQPSSPSGVNVATPTVTLTFTPASWNVDQAASFSVVDDCYAGNATIPVTVTSASSDSHYNGLSVSGVSITAVDDEPAPTVIVTPSSLSTTHGGSAQTVTVGLSTRPRADVTMAVSSSNTSLGTVSPSTLTFLASSTACPPAPQTVTLTPKNGSSATGNYSVVIGATSSSDPDYSAIGPENVSVTQN